jgi:glycerol uptake facilitator-like aquaporin
MVDTTGTVFLRDINQRPGYLVVWEKHRLRDVRWLVELFAEALGVFFYCYAGVGSTAAYIVGTLASEPGIGSLLQIGFAYAFGIMLAIVVCTGTSGGHFNPGVTISFVVFKGFPPIKGIRYIAAQIFGGYIACLLVYVQYKDLINLADEGLAAKGLLESMQFTPNGTGGIFALYTLSGANLSRVFLNEFVTDTILSLAIWACIDPSNFFVPPAAIPWAISFAYAIAIWGFAPTSIAANSARDIGGRLAAITIWGTKASGGTYAALAALTNIPAMLFGAFLYEFFLADSSRVVSKGHLEYLIGRQKHEEQHGGATHPIIPIDNASSADSTGKENEDNELPSRV